jgi:hypothetical protein
MAYATLGQLQLLLNLATPTSEQTEAMQRGLDEAAAEIDWELGYDATTPAPDPPPPLLVGVNLDRAIEHWKQWWSPGFGVIGAVVAESGPAFASRDSWYRHHLKLAPLKTSWGVA